MSYLVKNTEFVGMTVASWFFWKLAFTC